MKKTIHFLLCISIFILSIQACTKKNDTAEFNKIAPDIKLIKFSNNNDESHNSKKINLSDLKGNVVILYFGAAYLKNVNISLPSLIRLNNDMMGKPIKIITVLLDDDINNTTLSDFIGKIDIKYMVEEYYDFNLRNRIRNEFEIKFISEKMSDDLRDAKFNDYYLKKLDSFPKKIKQNYIDDTIKSINISDLNKITYYPSDINKTTHAYSIRALPRTFIINKKGVLVKDIPGCFESDSAQIKSMLDELMK